MSQIQLQKYLDKNTIKHPTALLHFERQLTDFEQGILFLCAHIVAKTERGDDGFYYLNKSLVRTVMRQEGNQDYKRIADAVKVVSKTDLKFNFLGEDRIFDDYEAPLIIGRATSKKRGVIAFEVHPRIEGVIKDPKVFSRLNIYFISALADVHRGYSFYALFKDHIDRTKQAEVTFDYWELRAYLGVEPDKYPAFKAFKQWVLKPLVKEVNSRTDIFLEYKAVKTGRVLTHLKFTIQRQKWQLPLFDADFANRIVGELQKNFGGAVLPPVGATIEAEPDHEKEQKALIDKCVKIGVTSKTVERAVKAHGVQGVAEIIAHTESRFEQLDAKGETYDPKNYLAKMLNDGIGVKSKVEREQAEVIEAKAKAEKAKWEPILAKRKRLTELAEIILQVEQGVRNSFVQAVPDWEASLDQETYDEIKAEVLAKAKSNFERSDFQKSGLLAATMRPTIQKIIAARYPDLWLTEMEVAQALGVKDFEALEAEYKDLKSELSKN